MITYPAELEASFVLPAIRKEICMVAVGQGLKQKEIAKILGVTEAAASQYLKGKRAAEINFDSGFKIKIKNAVRNILAKKMSGFEAVQTLATDFRLAGRLCRLHSKSSGVEPETCGLGEICLK